MESKERAIRIVRWMLSVLLVAVGLSATWAWGQVAQLAEPETGIGQPETPTLYASWQAADDAEPLLFRSRDQGQTWQALSLRDGTAPTVWVAGVSGQIAVALDDGTVLRSADGGDTWDTAPTDLAVLSLAWGRHDDLYLGTDTQGIYRLAANGVLSPVSGLPSGLSTAPIRQLAVTADGRLVAATRDTLYYSSDSGRTWTISSPIEDAITDLAAVDNQHIYVGTETMGVYETKDGGQTWELVSEGLGLAAGQMVRVTALQVDPELAGVLYATVDYLVGSTHVHASAAGAFVSTDGAATWQPMAGPVFPEARQASDLVVLAGKPLEIQAVTGTGVQSYAPDIAAALTALQGDDPAAQARAARLVGLSRSQDPEVASALFQALTDPDPGVSLAASRALGRIGNPETIGALLVALDHPSEQVRLGAARALGMMQAQAAVEPLSNMFLNGDGLTVSVAAEALGSIGTPQALEALLQPLADLTMSGQRHAALSALETAGDPAVEPLVALLDSPSGHVRRNAAEALGWVASPSATQALAHSLAQDRDAAVRQQAAWALGQIGDPLGRAALERAQLRDPVVTVQTQAASAMDRLPHDTTAAVGWQARWAPTLSRLEPLRWLLLGVSLLGAAWLAAGRGRSSPLPVLRRSE
ncbi:MAG: HEAT repeat domain-containing protein [Anaerolineae bacterium]|jgi:HEAT repeat protein